MFKILGNGAFANALKHVMQESDEYKYVIPAVPSYAVPDVLENENLKDKTIIFVSKGLLHDGQLLGEWAENYDWAVLAGPHFAHEIVNNLETYSVFGYESEPLEIANLPNMNVEFSTYKLEIQLLGALKNIYAYFFGVIDGFKMEQNFSAAMVTFVLREIRDIFENMQFNYDMIFSQAGIGDLMLTCTSKKSRNYTEGLNRVNGIISTHLSEAKHSSVAFNKRFGDKYKICKFVSDVVQLDQEKIWELFTELKNSLGKEVK